MSDELLTFEEVFEPEKEYVVTSLEMLKVASDPTRLRVLETLVAKPMTVKEIARILEVPATKLYYHVNLLEEQGLIRVVSQRVVQGIIEKQYRTRAYSFNVDRKLFALESGTLGEGVDTMLSVIFDATRDDVRRALQKGLMDPLEEDPANRRGLMFRIIAKFTPDDARSFQERLTALIKEYNQLCDAAEKEGREDELATYGLTVAFFPFPEETPNTRTTID